jgi:hypothetical protein
MACLLWQGGGGDRLPWSMLPVVALIGLCIGCYTWFDGQAVRLWGKPLDYLVWLTLLSAWPFPLLAGVARRAPFVLFWRTQWRLGLAVGCACCSATPWCCGPCTWGRWPRRRRCGIQRDPGGAAGHALPQRTFGGPRLLACGLVLAGMLVMKL